MPEYIIRAKAADGKSHSITTQDKSRVLRYIALFSSNQVEWSQVQVEVGGKTYLGPDWRKDLP